MMGWLSKLIIVDNLECPKYKRNFVEFLKKKLSSNKDDMLGSFNIDRVVQFGLLQLFSRALSHNKTRSNASWLG